MLPCESRSGDQLVLKLTPDLAITAGEATALDTWATGRHVVRLHDVDLDRGALLLERFCRAPDCPMRRTRGR